MLFRKKKKHKNCTSFDISLFINKALKNMDIIYKSVHGKNARIEIQEKLENDVFGLKDYLLEKTRLEEKALKYKKYTREDLIAECREKYPTFDLAPCCCCGSEAKLIFRFYDTKDGWGFPVGYAIECCIHCSQCEHMFDYILVFKDDYDSIEKCVNEYCARWNLLNTARHKSVVSACYGSMGIGRNVKLSELEDKTDET